MPVVTRSAPRRRALVGTLTAASLALSALAGCTPAPGGSASPGSTQPSTTLKVAASVEPTTLDMLASAAVAPAQLQLYNVYETLVKIDEQGKITPLLAASWEVSADRTTYTFHLDPKATFASGKAVSAEAVAKNIARAQSDAAVAAKHKAAMKVVASAKALDATTLEVKLARPSNTWLYAMGDTAGAIADPDAFGALATASAGSGPYAVKSWQRGDGVTLVRNEKYWRGTPAYEQVQFKYFADPNAMNAAMLSNTIDLVANEPTPEALAQFADTARYQVAEGSTNAEVTLGLNNATPALSDVRVRKAIALAIDKKKLIANVAGGKGTPLGTMDVPTDPYYEDLSGVNAYDPAAAKKLLAESGHATGLTLRFKPAALPYASTAAQQVASDLNAVGITTTISEQQFPAAWLDTVYKRADYDLTIVGHFEARDLVTYTNPNYYWRYSSKAFDSAYAAADQASEQEYAPKMKQAAKILADDAASVWLYMLPNLPVARAGLSGVAKNQTTDSIDITGVKG